MQTRLASFAIGAGLLGALTATASAQWSDGFETYVLNSAIDGQGEWDNWGGVPQPFNTVTNAQVATGSKALRMQGSAPGCTSCSDTISWLGRSNTFTPYTAGVWRMTCNVYVPSSLITRHYFILLSQFQPGAVGPIWNVQAYFDGATSTFNADASNNTGPGFQSLVRDAWVPLEILIDLDQDLCEITYNGALSFVYPWSPGVFGTNSNTGIPSLQAMDLFPEGASDTEIYYDDFALVLLSGSVGTNYCTSNPNSTGSGGTISGTGSPVAANNNLTLAATGLPNGQFGFFLNSTQQSFVPNPNMSQGNLCLGGAIGRYNAAGQLFNTGTSGGGSLALNLPTTPTPTGPTAITAGQTWNFQCWYRDLIPGSGPTSNFTNGLTVVFQ